MRRQAEGWAESRGKPFRASNRAADWYRLSRGGLRLECLEDLQHRDKAGNAYPGGFAPAVKIILNPKQAHDSSVKLQ